MSETWCDSSDTSISKGLGGEEKDSDLRDLTFDPDNATNTTTPSLRPPKLSEAQLLAALELGFSGKYLPSSVTGGDGVAVTQGNIGVADKSNNKFAQSASMINNTNNSNSSSNQNSGSQSQYPLFVDNYCVNLTAEEQEGLLDPLRRPDINQLPPDVLAVLLKSTRFEEILIPTQRRQTDSNASVNNSGGVSTSLNAQRAVVSETENTSGTTVSFNNNKNSPASATGSTQESELKSALSPFAKEFVPTSFQSKSTMNSQRGTSGLTFAMSQVQVQGQNDSFQGLVDDLDGSDCILSTVTDMITQVSNDPASLKRCTKVTVDVLKKHLTDEDTLGIVITLLVEQMISNANFCYSGAKILEALRQNQVGVGGSTIKALLLNRMQEEFTHCLNNLEDPAVRGRTYGVLRLLSELYMNFSVLPNQTKLHIFALAVLELMLKLIQNDKSYDALKCVCQLLKLIGWEVENSDSEKVRQNFNLVLQELKSAGNLQSSSQALVDMILKLQSNKWNREQQEAPAPPPIAQEAMPSRSRNQVYYELPDSDDDYFDDDTSIMIDDEPDDVQAAYEEFLKMSSKK